MRTTERIAVELLRRFAAERRRIIGAWRVLVEWRRVAQMKGGPSPEAGQVQKVLRELFRQAALTEIEGVPDVYRVDVPYADVIAVTEEQIVQEANPQAVFSHLTALAYHSLTDQIPGTIQATHYTPPDSNRIPLGTAPEEWVGLSLPRPRRPKRVGTIPVQW